MSKDKAQEVKTRFEKIRQLDDCPNVIRRMKLGQVRKDAVRAKDTETGTKYEVSVEIDRLVIKRIVWEEKFGENRFSGIQKVWEED